MPWQLLGQEAGHAGKSLTAEELKLVLEQTCLVANVGANWPSNWVSHVLVGQSTGALLLQIGQRHKPH